MGSPRVDKISCPVIHPAMYLNTQASARPRQRPTVGYSFEKLPILSSPNLSDVPLMNLLTRLSTKWSLVLCSPFYAVMISPFNHLITSLATRHRCGCSRISGSCASYIQTANVLHGFAREALTAVHVMVECHVCCHLFYMSVQTATLIGCD